MSMNRTHTLPYPQRQGSFEHILVVVRHALNAARDILAEAQEMRREAHRKHRFLDW